MRVSEPSAMAGQPARCGAEGSPSVSVNQVRTSGWKRSSGAASGMRWCCEDAIVFDGRGGARIEPCEVLLTAATARNRQARRSYRVCLQSNLRRPRAEAGISRSPDGSSHLAVRLPSGGSQTWEVQERMLIRVLAGVLAIMAVLAAIR